MLPGFWGPGCHLETLIDPANVDLVSRHSVETICMIWESCRCQRVVTGPMKFKKRTSFRKIVLPGFWGTWLPSNTLIDLANTALASKGSVKTKSMITEGYRTHTGVAGPKNFKKSGRFFSENRAPEVWGHWLQSERFN